MGLSLKKTLVGGIAAAVIATTAVTTSISASDANRITISPAKTSVNPGESFDVMVGYEPGDDGIAAFTIDLHYDNTKLEVYEPTSDELNGKYNVNTKFNYVSFNYTYSPSVVRITGYSMNNVKTNSNLALVTFKVKSGAKDSAGFWIDVDTMTTVDTDGSLKDAAYSVPTKTSMVKLPIKTQSATTTTTKPATTTTTAKTTTKVQTQASANNPATTSQSTTKVTTTPTVTTTPQVTTTTQAATTPEVITTPEMTTTPSVTTPIVSDTENVTTTPTVTTSPEDNDAPETEETPTEPIFEYTYNGEGDFEENDESNYKFNLSEYVSDFSKSYNIIFKLRATAGVNGAIGFNVDGSWTTENLRFTEAGEAEVTVSDVMLDANDADIYVPIYYMANGATFAIDEISVSEILEEEAIPEENPDEDEIIDDEPAEDEEDVPENVTDELPPANDENPHTEGGMPIWAIVAIPILMASCAVASVLKLRKKMK